MNLCLYNVVDNDYWRNWTRDTWETFLPKSTSIEHRAIVRFDCLDNGKRNVEREMLTSRNEGENPSDPDDLLRVLSSFCTNPLLSWQRDVAVGKNKTLKFGQRQELPIEPEGGTFSVATRLWSFEEYIMLSRSLFSSTRVLRSLSGPAPTLLNPSRPLPKARQYFLQRLSMVSNFFN